ncbi:hypothetical protein ACWGRK_04985 [Saccharomonospora azurea]|uniref:PE domain-containing protein n=1 Tax=Saccharomonospora azurea NA-128 TaxID=882081 RepID=H8G5P9_9PSEU|nr:hypothetical protein [Saccharomonospora azurea]EHK83660.1 hypothetical protein SZMC14600_18849 [Saccharomonospora azurea SZMC 14600]EHY89240.1 hypothetical protein SacazDRAFT_02332 [Saccharomonospora azurea NA-128]
MPNSSYADAAAFRAAAAEGQVGLDPDAAQAVLNKIRTGKDAVAALLDNTGFLAVSPKLGANPVGEAIATKFADRAAGMNDSYAQALRNLYTQYDDAEHAILEAMSRYDDFDASTAQSLTGQL